MTPSWRFASRGSWVRIRSSPRTVASSTRQTSGFPEIFVRGISEARTGPASRSVDAHRARRSSDHRDDASAPASPPASASDDALTFASGGRGALADGTGRLATTTPDASRASRAGPAVPLSASSLQRAVRPGPVLGTTDDDGDIAATATGQQAGRGHRPLAVPAHHGDATGGCCLLYTSPSPRDKRQSRMPSSA